MNASDAHIVVHQDPTTQQVFPLTEGVITIGREAYNDVILIDPEASRKHAQISFQAGRYVVEDLGSTNGTYVNGRQIVTPTTLNRALVEHGAERYDTVDEGIQRDLIILVQWYVQTVTSNRVTGKSRLAIGQDQAA